MKLRVVKTRHQQGVASVLTVIFFILIASVIAIGFMRLSLLENKQALEDSLSKSALTAAYSGVNDAKRAILYCLKYKNDPAHPECSDSNATGIYNQACPGFFSDTTLRHNVGIPDPDSVDGSIHIGDIGGTQTVNERYSCVVISNNTYDVSGPLVSDQAGGDTTVLPLRGTTAFNSIRISWQRRPAIAPNFSGLDYGGPGNETRANYRDSDAYGSYFNWNTTWPALLRMSLYAHPNYNSVTGTGGVTYNPDGSTNISQKTAFLYPRNLSTAQTVTLTGLIPRQLTNCNSAGYSVNPSAGSDLYLCQVTLSLNDPVFQSDTNALYLQLTNLYNDTDYVVELLNNGTPVKFDGVSPQIDSTGAVGSTFRRVQVRLRYHGSTPVLPNAIDTGSGLCKSFVVGEDPSIFSEACGY